MSISALDRKWMNSRKSYKNKLSKKKIHARGHSVSRSFNIDKCRGIRKKQMRFHNRGRRVKMKNGLNKGTIGCSGEVPRVVRIPWGY